MPQPLWLLEPCEPEVHSPWNRNEKKVGLLLSCLVSIFYYFNTTSIPSNCTVNWKMVDVLNFERLLAAGSI